MINKIEYLLIQNVQFSLSKKFVITLIDLGSTTVFPTKDVYIQVTTCPKHLRFEK